MKAGHASLRFDADTDALAAYVARLVVVDDLGLLTTTESRSRALVKKVRARLPKRYRVLRRHEYLFVWDTTRLSKAGRARLIVLTPLRFWSMGSLSKRFLVGQLDLRARDSRERVRVQVGHAPSGVQGGTASWRRNPEQNRVLAARRGFVAWGERIAAARGVVLAHMDANLDQRSPHWRGYLTHTLGAEAVWTGCLPPAGKGTHGSRVIDTAHVVGAPTRWPHLAETKRPEKVDHVAFVYNVDL